MFEKNEPNQIKLFITTLVIIGISFISTVSFGQNKDIPEFTQGIVDDTDLDLTGHIIVITDRGRFYPTPDYYCGSFEMLVYEAVVIHPSGGSITSLDVGIPAIYLNEALISTVEVWPGTRFEVVYVTNCNARGFSYDSRQMILELKKF
jgi:hypothetical protein